jgi:hypothetical protein
LSLEEGPKPIRAAFVLLFCLGLLLCGVWHIARGDLTQRLFEKPRNVRLVGALLLLLALPCFLWRGWYFLSLGTLLLLSGGLRVLAPDFNVSLQRRAYSRAVHGWVMAGGALLAWALFPG